MFFVFFVLGNLTCNLHVFLGIVQRRMKYSKVFVNSRQAEITYLIYYNASTQKIQTNPQIKFIQILKYLCLGIRRMWNNLKTIFFGLTFFGKYEYKYIRIPFVREIQIFRHYSRMRIWIQIQILVTHWMVQTDIATTLDWIGFGANSVKIRWAPVICFTL